MKKAFCIVLLIMLFGCLFADTYTIFVKGSAVKKINDPDIDVTEQYVPLEGTCFIDDEDTLFLEEGSMITFKWGKVEKCIKGPMAPITWGDLLIKMKLKKAN